MTRNKAPAPPASRFVIQRRADNRTLVFLLLVNIALAALWTIFLPAQETFDFLIGFVLGAFVLTIYERHYGRRIIWLVSFVGFVIREIIASNIELARLTLRAHPRVAPAIVAIPLRVTTDLEITVLASVITLTPGTLSIDLRRAADGRALLYVHTINLDNPAAFRQMIQNRFERRLLLVTKGHP
jgi:multicomponent Na+:H+ antiporter subunit E